MIPKGEIEATRQDHRGSTGNETWSHRYRDIRKMAA